MNERQRDATEAKIADVLRGMPEITKYDIGLLYPEEDGFTLTLMYADDALRHVHILDILAHHILSAHPYALREFIRNELGSDWPLDTSPRRAWEYTVLTAMNCPEGERDRPWIAISAAAILDAEARITDG